MDIILLRSSHMCFGHSYGHPQGGASKNTLYNCICIFILTFLNNGHMSVSIHYNAFVGLFKTIYTSNFN